MKTNSTRVSFIVAIVVAALGLTTIGCSSGAKLVPIEGQVTLDGQPLAFGNIRVIPATGRTAYATLDEQGRFKLMTDELEGCPVGIHSVTVGSCKGISETHQRRYAPEKYESGITTDLKIEVKGPKKDVVIELQGDGKRYPYEFKT